ncbi:MAG: hypothetical protein O7E54_06335 [Planctomycetota bacterium]|nr:hypothetical protein [Planctomycetota bacterium]
MVRLVVRLNRLSKIGATMIMVGVLLAAYGKLKDHATLNDVGTGFFLAGFVVYFIGRARDWRQRQKIR